MYETVVIYSRGPWLALASIGVLEKIFLPQWPNMAEADATSRTKREFLLMSKQQLSTSPISANETVLFDLRVQNKWKKK